MEASCSQEVAVPEPQNIVTTLHAPTVSRQDASFLPQKHNFVEVFDREPFVAKEKVPRFHRNGRPILNNGQTVWTEQFTNEEDQRQSPVREWSEREFNTTGLVDGFPAIVRWDFPVPRQRE